MTSSDMPPSAAPAEPEVSESGTPTAAPVPESAAGEPSPIPAHIAEQVAALDTLAELPLAEHVQIYQHLHAGLQDALADIDGP